MNLYNANQDSHSPVSASVLVQRLQAIENSRAIQSKRKATDPEEHKVRDQRYKRDLQWVLID